MSMSNIPINEDCIHKYNEMQLGKAYAYIIMAIKDRKEVVVEETGEPFPTHCTPKENEEVFNKVRDRLLACEEEPKFLLFDFRLETKDGRKPQKLAFINWCSDSCSINKKTLQGSTTEDLKKKFQGLGASIQANDHDELKYSNIAAELLSGK